MKICYIFRDPKVKGKSIEEIFLGISCYLDSYSYIEKEIFYYDNSKSFYSNIINIRKTKSDIYHLTGDVHFIVPFLLNKKIVNTVHDIGSYKHLTGIKKWLYGLFWIKLPSLTAKKETVVSKFTKKDLEKYFGIKHVTIIHNPVHPFFCLMPKDFNKKEPIILQVGTSPNKNVEGVISAIKEISCKLIIIGRLREWQRESLESNRIKYENYFDISYKEVAECYKKSDIVIFVSTHEGFGMPIIEGNAIGRPVVASNVCSLPEVAGDAAILVDPQNVMAIRKAIQDLIKDDELRDSYVKKGLKNAKRFNMKHIASQYMEVYQAILNN